MAALVIHFLFQKIGTPKDITHRPSAQRCRRGHMIWSINQKISHTALNFLRAEVFGKQLQRDNERCIRGSVG
ncbi:hypothetical protein BH09VER1_BH09VER1_07900 [soil metagenome]